MSEMVSSDGPRASVLRVKVVPGSSRTGIAGRLGESLKVTVSAAPEKGRANKALTGYLAEVLGVSKRDVTVVAGATQPRKEVRIEGLSAAECSARLAGLL